MSTAFENNKRIAKNTLALYFRQIIVMGVTLFTYRIVLQTLGVIDYGIYNVVGGVVVMFSFLSSTLMNITQRFINVEMEKGSIETLQKIFSTSLMFHFAIGVIVVILGETVGLWFIENKLVIPVERMTAARWVYQFALFGFLLSVINAPFMALVIAHEDMHIYGYVGVFEVVMKLVVVYLLVALDFDKLIAYSGLIFLVSCLVALFYNIYCRRKYIEARFVFYYDCSLAKELGRYGGYVFVRNIFAILRLQGVNILLNMFFGPSVNAARGLAYAVDNALLSFGMNFRKALNPQLTKSCVQDNKKNMWNLFDRGTRISYFLLLIFSVPVMLKTEFILKLWLGNVPEYTVIFVQLVIITALLDDISVFFIVIVDAIGKLKTYYCIIYVYGILVLVFSYIVLKMGYDPSYVFIVPVPLLLLSIPVRFIVMKRIIGFSTKIFTQKTLLPILAVSAVSFVPFYFVSKLFAESNFNSFSIIAASILWTGVAIIGVGLKKNERKTVFAFVKQKIFKG